MRSTSRGSDSSDGRGAPVGQAARRRKVGKEKYLLSDGKAQIRIEIEAEDFPKVRVDEKTRLRIRGEVEKDFLESPEIDVDAVTVL